VKVREHLKKGEHVAELEYTLHACAKRGGGFTIAHRAFRIVSLDGIAASDQRVAAAVDQLAPVTAAIPLIVVDAQGRFADIQGLEEMMRGLEKAFPKKKLAPIRGLLKNPAQVQLLKQAAAFRWRAWAEAWLSYDPALGRSHPVEAAAPVPGADRGAGELAFEGRTVRRAARLSASTKLEGNDAKRLVAAVLAAVDVPAADLDSMKVSASYRVNVETEWPEIRPHRAKTEKLVRVDVDGTTREALESHDWVFGWDGSKNAKAECK
jgi:hypothetical protein